MLDWACEIYRRELPEENIVRYEDIIESSGKALSAVVPAAEELDEPLESKNLNVVATTTAAPTTTSSTRTITQSGPFRSALRSISLLLTCESGGWNPACAPPMGQDAGGGYPLSTSGGP